MNKVHRQPNFDNILKVLNCEVPDRLTLFEFFMNQNLYSAVAGNPSENPTSVEHLKYLAKAYAACGYDYVTGYGCNISFATKAHKSEKTLSLNEFSLIYDESSFENYSWPDPSKLDYSALEQITPLLPGNMKIMLAGPGGVLENVMNMVGYDNLCMMIYDNEKLVQKIFDKVGSILLKYYEISAQYDSVGIIMSNDDWGFNTQTMLSPKHMRKYVFPWHKKIVEAAHKNGKPAVLHSCGNMVEIMEDVICDMKYDGRHSYEDNIIPVEEAYDRWGGRIAILGGMDVDFLVRAENDVIYKRCRDMLERTRQKGGYALGSGNSIPEYIPNEKYFTMTSAVVED